jgi:hypothetical protein
VSVACDDCGCPDTLFVPDQPRWERRAGIERYECLRCGAETTIETEPRSISRRGIPP